MEPHSDQLFPIDHDPTDDDDFDDEYDDGLDDDEGDEFEDCGMDADGGCGLVGTEFCDWTCPYEKPWEKKP